MVVSDFNPEGEAKLVALIFRQMQACEPFQQWFSRYQREREDTHFVLDMEYGLRSWIEQCFNQETAARKHNEDNDLKPTDADFAPEINSARDLRNSVGRYFSSIRMLQDVFVIDSKYYDDVFLKFWQVYCNIYREVANRNIEEPYEFEVIDSDEEPGISLVDDDGSGGGGGKPGPRGGSGSQRPKGKSMEQVLAILQKLHESAQLSAEQAQLWLMFQYIKADQEFCAYAKDDNYTEDEKFVEYKKVQSRYRRSLKTRTDFVQVERFKQMLNDNAEQLFAIFLADLHHVENGESDFDYDTTSTGTVSGDFSIEALMDLARRKMRPEYNERNLRQRIIETFADHFSGLSRYMRSINEVVRNFFMVLDTPSLSSLDGMDSVVKESLNMVCMAEGLSLIDKRMYLDMLLMRYEVYLKKLYYLIHGEELPAKEEGQGATLSNAIFAFPALRGLKNNPNPAFQEFCQRLTMVRQLRNEESHGSIHISEQEVDAALRIVIDMYLFVTGMNITELEAAGYDAEQRDATVISLHRYEDVEFGPQMAAEDIFIYGSIPVDLPDTKKEELTDGRLDLILMYAIGSGARQKTESAGKIAIGIKEAMLKDEQLAAYKSVKYLLFHYWGNPKAYRLTNEPVLVEPDNVPSDYLKRLEKDAVKYLLLEYNPQSPSDLGNIDILKTQRRGEIRYLPFVTTLESIVDK